MPAHIVLSGSASIISLSLHHTSSEMAWTHRRLVPVIFSFDESSSHIAHIPDDDAEFLGQRYPLSLLALPVGT